MIGPLHQVACIILDFIAIRMKMICYCMILEYLLFCAKEYTFKSPERVFYISLVGACIGSCMTWKHPKTPYIVIL